MTKILLSCTLLICSMAVMRLSIAKFFVAVLSFFRLREMLGVKRLKLSLAWIILFGLGINHSEAQIHLEESFRNKTKSHKVTVGGSATLTAIANINEHTTSNGWLRLTPDEQEKSGYATVTQKFSSTLGIIIEFEYKAWGDFSKGKPGANTKPGDGLSVFLYDGVLQLQDSDIGPFGGALGYAARTTDNKKALNKGYVCVGFDEFGNFSNSNELNGGRSSSLVPQAIGIRGPSGVKRDKSLYIEGTSTTLGGTSIQGTTIGYSISTTTRPLDDTFYRKVRIILLPTKNQRNNKDFTIEVQLQIKSGEEFYTVIKDVFVGELPPPDLKIGFAASTGGAVANHEIRDVKITTPVNFAITKTASKIAANATSDIITYKLLVANVGNNGAKATIADILPRGLTLVDRSISFTATNGRPSNFITNGNTGNIALTNMSVDLPPGASGIITYRAQTNVTNPNVFSLTNTATITPPNGFSDQNLNDNTSTAEVFIKPVLTNSSIGPICSGDPTTITLTSSPSSTTTTYQWTARQGQGNVTNFSTSGQGSIITEKFEAGSTSGTVIYTVTPTITTNGTVIHGNSKQFTVTVMPRTKKLDDLTATSYKSEPIVMIYNKDGTPMGNISTITWYTDSEGKNKLNPQPKFNTDGDDTTLDYKLTLLKNPGIYTYYATKKNPESCESTPAKYTITVESQVALAFEPSTVNGGDNTVLTAILTNSFVAPVEGITITLSRDRTSTAIENGHYTGPLPSIYIPAGNYSASTTINTQLDPTTEGPKTLTINGMATGGYTIASSPMLTINYQEQPIPITLSFTTPTVNGDGISKAELTAIIPAPVDEDITIYLGTNAASSTAVLDKNYRSFAPVITIEKGATSKKINVFIAKSDFLIGGRTTLVLTANQPTSSKGHNYIVQEQPSIDIIDMASAAIKLHFILEAVTGGQSSILTASFSSTNKIKTIGTAPVFRSVSPTTIILNRNDESTANNTHYTSLPTSITIPALTNSESTTISTYPTTGDINIFNGDKLLRVEGIPPTDGNQYPPIADADLLIKYPPINHHITLEFNPSTVEGGRASILTASLSGTMKAPTGGITISLHKVGDNLVETFSDHIYITAGQTSATIKVTTKVNTGGITQLTVTGPSNLPGYTLNSPATLTIEPTKPEITNRQLTNTICSGDPIGISLSSTLLNTTYRWTAKSSSTNITGFTNGNGVDINQVLTNNGATSETVTYTVVPVIRINDLEKVAGNSKDFVITVMPRTKTDTNSSHNLNDDNIKSETHNTDKFYDIDEIVDIKNQPGITYRWYHDLDPTTKPTLGNFNQLDIPIGPVGSQTYYYTKQEDGFCESGRTQVTLHITRNITLKFDQPNVQGGQSSTLIANLPTANETGQDIIIDIQQTSGDAKDKIHYTKPEQFQIIIKAGASSGSIEVGTILATQLLGQKTAVVTGIATNYTFGGPATLTISDRSEDKVITLKFDGDGTVQGGNLATLTASLPDNIKAPQGGITIVITNTPGLDRNSARKSRDFKARDLPQDIYIKAGESSGFIHIQTIDDSQPGVRNVIRPLTVMGTPNVGTMASPSTVLEIDQSDYPVGIKMSLYSGYNSDKAGEITSGYTAYLKIRPELSNAKKIPKYDYIIKLNVSNTPGRTEAVMGKHYDLTGIDTNGKQITQTITFNFNRNKEVIIPLFIAQKTNVIGEKKRLEFNPIVSNGDNFTPVFITIVENPPTEILLDFIPSSVNAGDPSILIAKFDQSKKDVGSPDITSIKDTEIKLVPSGNALSGTHYNGLPTSITIPAGRNSISVTIPTVDTREVNIQDRELKATGNSTDGYTIQNAPVLTIKYPTVPLPTIDNTKLEYEICSGSPFSITFNTNPKNDTRCVWTAEVKNGVTGASENTMGGNSIIDVLKNTGATPGKVIYTVTPITTTANGTKVKGDPKKIVVTVLPISAKINDNSWTLKDVNGLYSSPEKPKLDNTYTWYEKDKITFIHSSKGIKANCYLPISEPGTYTYYMTQTELEHCPGDFGKITITLTRSITLSFDTPTVGGGSQAKLTAKLAPGITAPIGGVDILLTPTTDHSTTAKNGANYIGLIDKITIPAGENSITIDAFTATNNHIIDGSTQLTLEGTGPMGYDINKPNPTIILLDKTGDDPKAKIITLAFDKHLVKGGDEAILTISLPKGVTSALPITITLGKVKDKSTAKRNINYRTYPDFITIPANKNHVEYHLKTLSEGDFGDIKSLWVNGKASGYRINTDGINIKNPDKIHIPNVFTPNDDGENDFWIITGIESYPKCTVRVYNRWGKRVFFSIGYAQPWDGKQSDQPLPIATYYYVIDLKNGSKPISGHVAIVR